MLQDRPTTTRSTITTLEDLALDPEIRALFDWLKDICSRSTGEGEQIFIYRRSSLLYKLVHRDTRGEIKAVGMSDLARVHKKHIRTLHECRLIQFRKGRWPGKWFTLTSNALGVSIS